jgi:hypothetical protein
VKSRTTAQFRRQFKELPSHSQQQARRAFCLFLKDTHHPSLRFKPVHPTEPIYSARIGLGYRAVGTLQDDEMIWFWIGSHAAYDTMLSQWKRR